MAGGVAFRGLPPVIRGAERIIRADNARAFVVQKENKTDIFRVDTASSFVHITGGTDVSPSGGGFFVVGALGGANIAMDNNEIMARNNGVASDLSVNHEGGAVVIGASAASTMLRIGAGAAVSGIIGIPNAKWITARNAANNGDVNMLSVGADNRVKIGTHLDVNGQVSGPSLRVTNGTNGVFTQVEGSNVVYRMVNDVLMVSMIIDNGARVGFGVVPSTSYKVDISGACHASSFPTSSDRRFKKNVQPIGAVLPKLRQINGVRFEWNEEYARIGRRGEPTPQIGVIAQEVYEQFPEIVSNWGDDEGHLGVDYGRLSAILLEGIKELDMRVTALEAKRGAI